MTLESGGNPRSAVERSAVQFQKEKPKEIQTKGESLLSRRYKGRGSRAEDVQQKHLVHIQFSNHLVVALVKVAGKFLRCSLPVLCVIWRE